MATWTGAGDGTSWNDPNNWSAGGAPNFVPVTIAYLSSALPVVVNIGKGQTFAAEPLTLGLAGVIQNVTLNNAGTFTVNGGVATLDPGTKLHNTNTATLNGGAVIYGSIVDDGTLVMEGSVTVETGGLLQIDSGFSGHAGTQLIVNGTMRVSGAMTSPTGVTGNGAAIVDGGSLNGGSGNPLQIGAASISFSILDGGSLNVTPPAAADSFAFGAVTTVNNTLIIPSYSGIVTSRISSFGAGDLINVNVGASGVHTVAANGDGSYTIIYGSVALRDVILAAGTTASQVQFAGGVVSVICFAAGTRIRTNGGDVAVEMLRPGDMVATLSGDHEPVRWIGERRIDLTRHPDRDAAAPVRIRAGALGDDVPARDLLVSPDHAIYLDGVLISARQLVNGTSVIQDRDCRTVHYFHVELDRHAVVLAEDAPAESYLDSGNRGWFMNAGRVVALHPMAASADRQRGSCAPFATDEATVEPVWRRLADRAATNGLGEVVADAAVRAAVREPGLHVLAGGLTVLPESADELSFRFALPPGCDSVVLASRASRPTDLRPWLDDRRRLGVQVARILVQTHGQWREMRVDDAKLTDGWWGVERSGPETWRWTDGEARIGLGRSAAMLEVRLTSLPRHPAAELAAISTPRHAAALQGSAAASAVG